MKIYFIQNFIRDLIIIFVDQSGKVKKISLKSVISLDEVIDKVNKIVEDETLITEVKLKGRSSILRAIELYYNKLEGVNVKWL
jgi:hypothetical protein